MNTNRRLLLCAGAALLLAGGGRALAQDAASNANPNFSPTSETRPSARSFEIIEQNNIFDPTRRPRRPQGPTGPTHRYYNFTLNGTMTYENQEYAFFNGTGINRDHFAKSDTINGYKIVEITNNTVKLEGLSNQVIKLQPGMQMQRVDNGPWTLAASSMRAADSDSSGQGSDSNNAGASTVPSIQVTGAESDVLKRLLARHLQENGESNNNSATTNGDQNQ